MDYFKIFTEEEPNQGYYRELYKIEKVIFNEWFNKNSSNCKVNSIEDISPSKKIKQKLQNNNYNPLQNQCHFNSQMACLLYEKLSLYTGFFINCDEEIITHSFCFLENKIIDFTAVLFWNRDEYRFNENKFPLMYFGVKLGREFLNSIKTEVFENENRSKPYLYEWYIHSLEYRLNDRK